VYVSSFEEWNSTNNQKYDMVFSAQAFHLIDKNIKYKKCHNLLKDKGYLVLFWYSPCNQKSDKTREIQKNIDVIVNKYINSHYKDNEKSERIEHDGIYKDSERKAEIELSGLFKLIEKLDYSHEIKENAEQYLKAMKSTPAFVSKLDGIDDKIIETMDNEIIELINKYGGYVGTLFNFSLYITIKIGYYQIPSNMLKDAIYR